MEESEEHDEVQVLRVVPVLPAVVNLDDSHKLLGKTTSDGPKNFKKNIDFTSITSYLSQPKTDLVVQNAKKL